MSLLSSGSSLRNEDSRNSTLEQYDHLISLVDHTRPESNTQNGTTSESEAQESPSRTKAGHGRRSQKLNRGALREELARRKYAKWQEDESVEPDQPGSSHGNGTKDGKDSSNGNGGPVQTAQGVPEGDQQQPSRQGQSALQRGRNRVKRIPKSKKATRSPKDEDVEVDILYENQRGSFFFGIPLFSANSLLNFDPSPWVDGHFKTSPVDITNAQVPDPSWEWAWKSWYVDMSHDVDEEGWEYSFSFQRGFAWHGTHVWFHSFARRRRWLRKRVRKQGHGIHAGITSQATLRDAHMLNTEYFTIHPTRDGSLGSSRGTSRAPSTLRGRFGTRAEYEEGEPVGVISDIPTLMARLRKAAIDREKVVAVKRFLDQAGEELYYLAEQMPAIMSLFVFQNSRRQLLAMLMRRFDEASNHRQQHQNRDEPEDEAEKRKIDNLLNALKAADEQVKRLEYWSDVKTMVREGETIGATDDAYGWDHGWQGVDSSGPKSNDGASPTRHTSEDDHEVRFEHMDLLSLSSHKEDDKGGGGDGAEAATDDGHHSDVEGELSTPDKGKGRAD